MPRSCEAAHEDSKVKAQEGGEIHHKLLITDPWSKVEYSPHIREASMAMEGLPEGVDPFGRVPEQLLQAAPILKRRRRRNKEVSAKKGYGAEGFRRGCKYRRKRGPRGPTGQPGGPLARPRLGPHQAPSWLPGDGPPSIL